MEQYLEVKLIKASKEMSRKEYCDYRGWDLPKDEDGDDRVYLVEYEPEPNSKPNHPDHEGYISMSPKDVFEKAYRKITGLTGGLAIEAMNQGFKVKVPEWKGYWFKESGMVKVMTAEGEVLETPHFQQYIFREDWMIIE